MSPEVPLAGGNVGVVVRIGDTVRRATGPWTPAVHALLLHLEAVGFAYSPRVLGIDEQGREVLSHIDGETVGDSLPWPTWAWSDRTLEQVGAITRHYHEAVRTFEPRAPSDWRFQAPSAGPDDVICHNDIAPYNIVVKDGDVVGLIDWDLAGPGPTSFDLAHVAWTFAPITTDAHAAALGAPTDPVRRLRLLCDSYGLADRTGLLDYIATRIAASITGIRHKAAAGEAAFAKLLHDGHVDRMGAEALVLQRHHDRWSAEL